MANMPQKPTQVDPQELVKVLVPGSLAEGWRKQYSRKRPEFTARLDHTLLQHCHVLEHKVKYNPILHYPSPGKQKAFKASPIRDQESFLPVIVIRVKWLVAGLVTIDSLHKVLHGIGRITVPVIRAGQFYFLQQGRKHTKRRSG